MPRYLHITAVALLAASLSGCCLHGDWLVRCHCQLDCQRVEPAEGPPCDEQIGAGLAQGASAENRLAGRGRSAVSDPVPPPPGRFHPVPTYPVFFPSGVLPAAAAQPEVAPVEPLILPADPEASDPDGAAEPVPAAQPAVPEGAAPTTGTSSTRRRGPAATSVSARPAVARACAPCRR